MPSIPIIDRSALQGLLAGERPVVVDFYADWCRPCHALAPELESLAQAFAGEVEVVKVDVDAEPDLAQTYGVMSIPTVVHFAPGGAEAGRSIGLVRAAQLAQNLGLGALTG